MKRFSSRYHIQQVPWYWKIPFNILCYWIGFFLFLYFYVVRTTCKYKIEGTENLRNQTNIIFCHWHTFSPHFYPHFIFRDFHHAWMSHPTWIMKPVLLPLRWMGIKKFIYGSSGHSGKKAASQLVLYLRNGYSTVVMPDGPNGPAFKAKKGVLTLAEKSNVPIVPIQIECSKSLKLNTWDKKQFPIPFSKIQIRFCSPIKVKKLDTNNALDLIQRAMSSN